MIINSVLLFLRIRSTLKLHDTVPGKLKIRNPGTLY